MAILFIFLISPHPVRMTEFLCSGDGVTILQNNVIIAGKKNELVLEKKTIIENENSIEKNSRPKKKKKKKNICRSKNLLTVKRTFLFLSLPSIFDCARH